MREDCVRGVTVLGPAQELKERHRQVMQGMLMDMLRALATPNMDIRKKTLDIALDLINQHNIDEVSCSPAQSLLSFEQQKSSLRLSMVFMCTLTHSCCGRVTGTCACVSHESSVPMMGGCQVSRCCSMGPSWQPMQLLMACVRRW